jgi:hypothetical protein
MEEERQTRQTRRLPVLAALAGVILLAAIWATMALAGGSTSAAKPKPTKAPAAKAQVSKAHGTFAGKHGDERCPFDQGASNDL